MVVEREREERDSERERERKRRGGGGVLSDSVLNNISCVSYHTGNTNRKKNKKRVPLEPDLTRANVFKRAHAHNKRVGC